MATPNEDLRAARERTSSRQHPGECLSRQELADLVNAHVWDRYAVRVEVDAGYIGKLERGVIRWPGGHYREAFRTILGVVTDAELGLRNTRRATVPIPSDASSSPIGDWFQALGSANSSDPFLGTMSLSAPNTVPSAIDHRHIRDVEVAAKAFSHWDHLRGGWSLLDAALAQARWAGQLLRASCPHRLRSRLYAAVADLVGTCGFKLYDTGAHEEANRYLRFALTCAEKAGDGHRRAKILTRMVRLAVETGQSDRALTIAEYGLLRVDRLSPVRQAMLHVAHGKALAATGRGQEAVRAIGAADESFCRAPDDDSSPLWADLYTSAHHAGDTAEVLAILRAKGLNKVDIGPRFLVARDGFGVKYPRARVVAELKVASLTMATGDPVEAAAVATTALDTAESISSGRVIDLLRTLDIHAARHHGIIEVQGLRQHIREAIASH